MTYIRIVTFQMQQEFGYNLGPQDRVLAVLQVRMDKFPQYPPASDYDGRNIFFVKMLVESPGEAPK